MINKNILFISLIMLSNIGVGATVTEELSYISQHLSELTYEFQEFRNASADLKNIGNMTRTEINESATAFFNNQSIFLGLFVFFTSLAVYRYSKKQYEKQTKTLNEIMLVLGIDDKEVFRAKKDKLAKVREFAKKRKKRIKNE